MKKDLVIVAGAAGEIGTAFIKKLIEQGIETIGITRTHKVDVQSSGAYRSVKLDLVSDTEIKEKIDKIGMSSYDRIIYFHSIGVDKFDPRGYPNIKPMHTIDPNVYETNVNTFKHLFKYLTKRTLKENLKLKTVIIAGVADKHVPFVIESFCEAKFIVRQYIISFIEKFPNLFSGLSINITSTITKSALKVRPNADTAYWLTPDDVAEQGFGKFMEDTKGYSEINIIKHNPDFKEDYYDNVDALYDKWSKETGIYT